MFSTTRFEHLRRAGLALAMAAIVLAVPGAASAQGLFDFLFGRRPAPQPQAPVQSYAAPDFAAPEEGGAPRAGGPGVSYCVRLCDGRYFPINRSATSAVETCQSLCPATKTKIYSGSGIDHAVASDGRRYADMPNAFVYRDKLVTDCSCNGRKPTGLSFVDPKSDPTLRPGDIVATNEGMVAYAGARRGVAEFTPVNRSAVSAEMLRRLSDLKIAPRNADGEAPANTNAVSTDTVRPQRSDAVRPQRSQASR